MRGGSLGSSAANPSHPPLLYGREGQSELVQSPAVLKNMALITQTTNCDSATSGKCSPTSSPFTLCTPKEHSFPPSPSREMPCGVPVRPQMLSSSVFSCNVTGERLGLVTSVAVVGLDFGHRSKQAFSCLHSFWPPLPCSRQVGRKNNTWISMLGIPPRLCASTETGRLGAERPGAYPVAPVRHPPGLARVQTWV